MGSVVGFLFNDSDDSAQKAQLEQNQKIKEYIDEKGHQARADLLELFDVSDDNRNLGNQAALNVFADALPESVQALQLGNVGAQAAILGGTPTINMVGSQGGRATLGEFNERFTANKVPLSGIDTGFMRQTIPSFTSTRDVIPSFSEEFNSDADLLLAAAQGRVPGISEEDQIWFGKFLADGRGQFSNTRNFLDNPDLVSRQTIGVRGGLNPENEMRLGNLLSAVRRYR